MEPRILYKSNLKSIQKYYEHAYDFTTILLDSHKIKTKVVFIQGLRWDKHFLDPCPQNRLLCKVAAAGTQLERYLDLKM